MPWQWRGTDVYKQAQENPVRGYEGKDELVGGCDFIAREQADVSAASKVVQQHSLTLGKFDAMSMAAADDIFFPRETREPDLVHLRLDIKALVERKRRNRELSMKLMCAVSL